MQNATHYSGDEANKLKRYTFDLEMGPEKSSWNLNLMILIQRGNENNHIDCVAKAQKLSVTRNGFLGPRREIGGGFTTRNYSFREWRIYRSRVSVFTDQYGEQRLLEKYVIAIAGWFQNVHIPINERKYLRW